uniref:Uncharacterized protein n=1 Tax=Arundo donax TaxID=35708 RepID=A0A0A9A7C1_ARUDO
MLRQLGYTCTICLNYKMKVKFSYSIYNLILCI